MVDAKKNMVAALRIGFGLSGTCNSCDEKRGPMRDNNKYTVLILLVSLVGLSGCVRTSAYEHFDFSPSMTVTEVGKPEGIDTIGVNEYPIRYQLQRKAYTLHAVIDPYSNNPAVVFWAVDSTGSVLPVEAQPIRCRGAFRYLGKSAQLRRKFPVEKEFVWLPTSVGSCRTENANESGPFELNLRIGEPNWTGYEESLVFRVVRNGLQWEFDSV